MSPGSGDKIRSDGSRWGFRVIRPGGRVRWQGRWWKLEDGPIPLAEYTLPMSQHEPYPKPTYDGSMDEMVGLFYKYRPGTHDDLLCLHSVVGELWPGPSCVEGAFVWERFRPEPPK